MKWYILFLLLSYHYQLNTSPLTLWFQIIITTTSLITHFFLSIPSPQTTRLLCWILGLCIFASIKFMIFLNLLIYIGYFGERSVEPDFYNAISLWCEYQLNWLIWKNILKAISRPIKFEMLPDFVAIVKLISLLLNQ